MTRLEDEIRYNNIFTSKKFTYEQYVNQLVKLQELICHRVFKKEYHEAFRLDDAISEIRKRAIINNLDNTNAFFNGIAALKLISKQLAISFSGKKAENHVDAILKKYVTREDFVCYRGIYLNDGIEDTEIDNLILTKNGFLLLEIKNIKSDVRISEDGRLFVDGDCSFEQTPLAEKMDRKRRLFKSEIKRLLKEKRVHIDIDLQTRIVFNEPKNSKFYITNCSNEKWCKSSQLAYIVNDFSNKFPYSDEQYGILKSCCEEFERHQKLFVINYDIDETLNSVCALIDLIEFEDEKVSKKNRDVFSANRPLEKFPISLPLLSTVFGLIGISSVGALLASNTLAKSRR